MLVESKYIFAHISFDRTKHPYLHEHSICFFRLATSTITLIITAVSLFAILRCDLGQIATIEAKCLANGKIIVNQKLYRSSIK